MVVGVGIYSHRHMSELESCKVGRCRYVGLGLVLVGLSAQPHWRRRRCETRKIVCESAHDMSHSDLYILCNGTRMHWGLLRVNLSFVELW